MLFHTNYTIAPICIYIEQTNRESKTHAFGSSYFVWMPCAHTTHLYVYLFHTRTERNNLIIQSFY